MDTAVSHLILRDGSSLVSLECEKLVAGNVYIYTWVTRYGNGQLL